MNSVEWEVWPPTKYPCVLIEEWECPVCGTPHVSEFSSSEAGDDDMDSFDFYCGCGEYFKKFWRVPVDSRKRSGWYISQWKFVKEG